MYTELRTGWLSPTGEFVETGLYEHLSTARSLARLYGFENNSKPDSELLARCWVSISISSIGCKEWMIAWWSKLTPEQISFLRPYFDDVVPVNDGVRMHWEDELQLA